MLTSSTQALKLDLNVKEPYLRFFFTYFLHFIFNQENSARLNKHIRNNDRLEHVKNSRMIL